MAFTVRPGGEADLPACAALYERVVRETFVWLPPDHLTDAPFWEAAPHEELYVAEDEDGRLLGFASYYRPDGGFLHSLYVDKAARAAGVGSALFNYVLNIGLRPVSLKVQKLNTPAIAFYRRRGLEIIEAGGEGQPGGGWFRMREKA